MLGDEVLVHRFDPDVPLTDVEPSGDEIGIQNVDTPVKGLVVVTQTCDIVRSCTKRPFLEVCPLVAVGQAELHDIERERLIQYAYLPNLAGQHLVADLDRVMTVEKPVAAKWKRTPGWNSEHEGRRFAGCLSRKRVRFAFPDDFTGLARKLLSHLKSKHGKDSPEGRALKALQEIRVRAAPSWNDLAVSITIWFIPRDKDADFEGTPWDAFVQKWLQMLPEGGRYTSVDAQVAYLEDLTAADYVESDPLDLDYLSSDDK